MGGPPGGLGERGGRSLAQRILDRDADGDGKVIHSRPEAAWTVTSLAEQVNMSKSAFSERFREVVGKPPLHYLTEYRLRKACQLLSETRLGVKEISSQVGYDSVSSFSTAFKRWIGNSPSAFHRNGRTAV
jgi:AraC-like DNA-binding protein